MSLLYIHCFSISSWWGYEMIFKSAVKKIWNLIAKFYYLQNSNKNIHKILNIEDDTHEIRLFLNHYVFWYTSKKFWHPLNMKSSSGYVKLWTFTYSKKQNKIPIPHFMKQGRHKTSLKCYQALDHLDPNRSWSGLSKENQEMLHNLVI